MGTKILIEKYFSFNKYSRTRGHEVTLVKDWISKGTYFHRGINDWNKLSTYCGNANSVNMFKKQN